MNKKILYVVGALVIAVVFFFISGPRKSAPDTLVVIDYKTASYMISGKSVKLSDSDMAYFGNETRADINSDGREDIVFLASRRAGESIWYFVFAALDTESGYVGSQGLLLGDRIAPQTTNVDAKNLVVVNYAVRGPGENSATNPSVGKSIWLKFDQKTMQFGEVVQNFEGEADTASMTLSMKPWVWMSASISSGETITPD